MKIAILQNNPGLCNRIFIWECIYEIAKINNATIVCNWEELEFLDFPNTEYDPNLTGEGYIPFNSMNKNLISNNFVLPKGYNFIATCGWGFNRHFEETHYREKKSPKQQIKLKDNELSYKIEETVKNAIGVHIRRGDYRHSDKFILSSGICTPDYWFINLMNQYKDKYRDVRFYISSDAEKDMLKVFYDNFDIIDCESILGRKANKFRSSNAKASCPPDGIVDLFALSKTKEIICSVSTWSMFAYQTGNKPYIMPAVENQTLESIKYWDNIKR